MATLKDLRPLSEIDGPFVTILVPAPSANPDARHRFEVECKNALRQVSSRWPADEVHQLEKRLLDLPHDLGAALFVTHAAGGPTFYEFIQDPVAASTATEGPDPRLAPLIEARQRTVAHVVVEVDKSGADIVAFDGGTVLATDEVIGETVDVQHGHPGGWSQRKFRRREENTWEENAENVAHAVAKMVSSVGARLVCVVGPPRASNMVGDALSKIWHGGDSPVSVELLEAGDPDGVADEIVRLTSDVVARDTTRILKTLREETGNNRSATSAKHVEEALAEGRVRTLLVHDAADDGEDGDGSPRLVDRFIRQALRTDAEIRVVPNVDALDRGAAAILRW